MSGALHTSQAVVAARRLAAGGWGPTRIAQLLEQEGHPPVHPRTVARWLDPARVDARRVQQRHDRRRDRLKVSGGRLRVANTSSEFRIARLQGLAAAGVSCNAIAKVMRFDGLEPELTESQVRQTLATGRYPKALVRPVREKRGDTDA